MASATRPWCNSVARKDPEVRAWLNERERKHIPLIQNLIKNQQENKGEAIFEIPLGTWFLDLPEMAALRRTYLRDSPISADVMSFDWMRDVREQACGPVLFLAEGLLMYLSIGKVRELVLELRKCFPGSELLAEVFNEVWLDLKRRDKIDRHLQDNLGFGAEARFVSGLRESDDMEQWGEGIRLVGEWSFVDENEPKLGRLRKLRHFPGFRKRQWVVHYQLG